jgi:hypothetical protein
MTATWIDRLDSISFYFRVDAVVYCGINSNSSNSNSMILQKVADWRTTLCFNVLKKHPSKAWVNIGRNGVWKPNETVAIYRVLPRQR